MLTGKIDGPEQAMAGSLHCCARILPRPCIHASISCCCGCSCAAGGSDDQTAAACFGLLWTDVHHTHSAHTHPRILQPHTHDSQKDSHAQTLHTQHTCRFIHNKIVGGRHHQALTASGYPATAALVPCMAPAPTAAAVADGTPATAAARRCCHQREAPSCCQNTLSTAGRQRRRSRAKQDRSVTAPTQRLNCLLLTNISPICPLALISTNC